MALALRRVPHIFLDMLYVCIYLCMQFLLLGLQLLQVEDHFLTWHAKNIPIANDLSIAKKVTS